MRVVSNRIVIIGVTITIIAVAAAAMYVRSDNATKDTIRNRGKNCPIVPKLLDSVAVENEHAHTEVGRYVQELRDLVRTNAVPMLFESESGRVAEEFRRLDGLSEEDVRRLVEELQTTSSIDNASSRVKLFVILLHHMKKEEQRRDTVR